MYKYVVIYVAKEHTCHVHDLSCKHLILCKPRGHVHVHVVHAVINLTNSS